MALVTLTPRLRAAAQLAIALSSRDSIPNTHTELLDKEATDELTIILSSDWDDSQTVSHSLVARIARTIRQHAAENGLEEGLYELRELLKGSTIVHEAPKAREKSPELLALLQKARIDQENRDYVRMVSGVAGTRELYSNGTSRTPNLSIAVFAAVYYFGDSISNDVCVKTLIGLACALVVAVAEGWFFMRDWLALENTIHQSHTNLSISTTVVSHAPVTTGNGNSHLNHSLSEMEERLKIP
ncbi:hypothetical protein SeMB42_g07570 [Synchytrium endobioticum]|uniref:Uncharacterized protein n=1 Tax=Synchytrium endobioticum TaxID=286115 RepID=A0A507C4E0_9FUNG|nr:hypothetical protein SeMB42_g07570 [Synchytrium endobioticum]TPX38833.1 hypothetical protein SeLEV6574_g07591 [Synchytrium endobioticum]